MIKAFLKQVSKWRGVCNMPQYEALVFFDLDGTLLNERAEISPAVATTIRKLMRRRIMPVVASGRCPFEIERLIAGTGMRSYISMNGQYVVWEGEPIMRVSLPTEDIADVYRFAEQYGHPLVFFSKELIAATHIDRYMKIQYLDMDHSVLPLVDPTHYEKVTTYLLYLCSPDETLDCRYYERFADRFTILRDSIYHVSFSKKGITKKTGIDFLTDYLGLQHIPKYAFGDSNNDVTMIESVDFGVAMGNAVDRVKAKAGYITKENNRGGIIYGLRHYGLI